MIFSSKGELIFFFQRLRLANECERVGQCSMPPKKTEKPAKRISVDKQLTALEAEREEISYDKHPERHGILFSAFNSANRARLFI